MARCVYQSARRARVRRCTAVAAAILGCTLGLQSLPTALAAKEAAKTVATEAPPAPHVKRSDREAKAEAPPPPTIAPTAPQEAAEQLAPGRHRRGPQAGHAPLPATGGQPIGAVPVVSPHRGDHGAAPARQRRRSEAAHGESIAPAAGAESTPASDESSANAEALARHQKKGGKGGKGGKKAKKPTEEPTTGGGSEKSGPISKVKEHGGGEPVQATALAAAVSLPASDARCRGRHRLCVDHLCRTRACHADRHWRSRTAQGARGGRQAPGSERTRSCGRRSGRGCRGRLQAGRRRDRGRRIEPRARRGQGAIGRSAGAA